MLEFRSRMRLLYVIFVASIAVILWAAYAVARTIRSHRRQGPAAPVATRLDVSDGKGPTGE